VGTAFPAGHDWAPPAARPMVEAAIAAARADPRIVGLMVGGSAGTGTMDEFSDLDFVVVCRDEHQPELRKEAPAFAAGLGPLLACFTGEHVGEPRLLIALYGPPPLHVDLKFVADRDLDDRVEDGLVLWQRDGAVEAALRRAEAVWPRPDPQWIEDRFWVWIHYGGAKVGRGELFECLDVLAALRGMVFGPLIALGRGQRAAGVRRLERLAPDLVPALAATVGDHTAAGCLAALRASVDLYRRLRGPEGSGEPQGGAPEDRAEGSGEPQGGAPDGSSGLVRRADAEAASLDYLAEIQARVGTP
jgi:hypothetical protein